MLASRNSCMPRDFKNGHYQQRNATGCSKVEPINLLEMETKADE
jgi:hypothetical protein